MSEDRRDAKPKDIEKAAAPMPDRSGDGERADVYAVARQALMAELDRDFEETGALTNRPRMSKAVRGALERVPRHCFVPEAERDSAYENRPLPIGDRQTISQPYIVALMTELAAPGPKDRVLEVGTGSGYQCAVLAELAAEVYSIEFFPDLAARAERVLNELGYRNLHLKTGDGSAGWPEHAPYDVIVVTAAGEGVPRAFIDQLAPGGRLVIPVADKAARNAFGRERALFELMPEQNLLLVTKDAKGKVKQRRVLPVAFVPLLNR